MILKLLLIGFFWSFSLGNCRLGLAGTATDNRPRYISLAPSTTEILFALGLSDEIVGVSTSCDYPKEALFKERVGDFSRPSIEKILSLKPDYIFCTGLEQAPVVEELRKLDLKVCVADPASVNELFDSILRIGMLTGKGKEAGVLVDSMQERIGRLVSKTRFLNQENKPRVFLEIWHSPLMTAGRGSFIDELITLAGGMNIAHDTKRPYSIFSPEEVIRRNPDCIIFTYMDSESPGKLLGKRLGWSGINAVKNKRLYNDIDSNILLRPGPRAVEGMEELHKRLYP